MTSNIGSEKIMDFFSNKTPFLKGDKNGEENKGDLL